MLFLTENVNTTKTKAIAGMRADIETINTTFDIIALKEEMIKSEVAYLSLSEEGQEAAKPVADEKKKNFIKTFFAKVQEFFRNLLAKFKNFLDRIKNALLEKAKMVELHEKVIAIINNLNPLLKKAFGTKTLLMTSNDLSKPAAIMNEVSEELEKIKSEYHEALKGKTKIYTTGNLTIIESQLNSASKDFQSMSNALKSVEASCISNPEQSGQYTSMMSKYMDIATFCNTLASYLASRLAHIKAANTETK